MVMWDYSYTVLIWMSKYTMSGWQGVVIPWKFSTFLTDSVLTIFEIASSDVYDVFIISSTAENNN